MSAIAANVFSGLMNEITAAARNRSPNSANSHFIRSVSAARAKFCAETPRNMIPTMTPTVVIDA